MPCVGSQTKNVSGNSVKAILEGPGTELKKLIAKLGLTAKPGCKCNQRRLIRNQWCPDKCLENIDTIVDWLSEEAERAKLPFTAIGARIIVKRAIRNAKKNQGLREPPLSANGDRVKSGFAGSRDLRAA